MITDGDAVWTMVQCPSVEDRGTVVVQGPLAAPRAAGEADHDETNRSESIGRCRTLCAFDRKDST